MAKVALGRGLEALIPTSAEGGTKRDELQTVAVNKIAPNPYQPRKEFDSEKLKELADSIKIKGLLQPILVKKNGDAYLLVAGERRFRAARMAGLEKIPALVLRDLSETDMLQIALIENVQRENLNPIEAAEAYKMLLEKCQLTQNQLSERVGKNRASVANTMRLLTLPEHIKKLVAENKLSEGHARAILSVSDPVMQDRIASRILQETLSVRQAETMARREKRRKLVVRKTSPAYQDAESFLKQTLGTSVKIVPGLKKGRIEIEYYGTDDLNRLLDMFRKLS